ncbi:MAG: sialate O-acetylesterase, partial [Lentisphaerae bacterium]|nr:sialate O-acetylesterase [Lentisphaerota bacterium]
MSLARAGKATDAASQGFSLADIFGDSMVLQQGMPVRIWGRGPARRQITVSFSGQVARGTVDDTGVWAVELMPLAASSVPADLLVLCEDTIVVRNVLVGEVWHASGQSNMDCKMADCTSRLPEIGEILAEADLSDIRYRAINQPEADVPQSAIADGGAWLVSTPATAAHFSAVAFLVARRLHAELNVPIGIIETAWGGHPIEPFIPESAFDGHPVLRRERELAGQKDWDGLRSMVGGVWARDDSWLPGTVYNSRIAPIVGHAIRGVLWYQAESNCGEGEDPRFYCEKMKALIRGWRAAWRRPDLPVYYVQLPQYTAPGWAPMRDEQRRAMYEPNTGMAVTIDLALDDIHPANKLDVAERLARWPLAQQYGKDVIVSGPLFKSMHVDGGKAVLTFEHVDGGL